MVRTYETTMELPHFRPVPLTRLPLIYDREHLFPYGSYCDTAAESVGRVFRVVVLENEFLRVEVVPELGGRVYGMYDKRAGREVLFRNPVVKPVRILPIWAFISGGIEFNFPIAHSPTSVAEVGCRHGGAAEYGWVRVGEREARTGMEWVVELGLAAGHAVLVQRTALRNGTGTDWPWMSWSIAAVLSTPGTEFVHGAHRVLVHDDRVREADWPGAGLNWERQISNMTGFFWKPGGAEHFGVFDHERGVGLLHHAARSELPGKKVWTYGHGRHRVWGQGTTEGGGAYAEIESGPLLDQSEKPLFPRGTERRTTEYWVPVQERSAFDRFEPPRLAVPSMAEPWLGWGHSVWQQEWEAFRVGAGPLPMSVVPTGLELEGRLREELARGNGWACAPLALWLAFRGRPEEALEVAVRRDDAGMRRVAGLIRWRGLGRPEEAVRDLAAGPLEEPWAVVELDRLLAELGRTGERVALLAGRGEDRFVVERRADLALAMRRPDETLRLLSSVRWPREHQRYVRSDLWRRAQSALGQAGAGVPEELGEDNLAPFGAYWSEE
jgi:hypothetical protein